MKPGERPCTAKAQRVFSVVATAFDVAPSQLRSRANSHYISHPRMIAWKLLRDVYGWSQSTIGKYSGTFHHTTVRAGLLNVDRWLQDKDFSASYAALRETVIATEKEVKLVAARRLTRLDILEAKVAVLEAMFERLVISRGDPGLIPTNIAAALEALKEATRVQ